MRASLVDNVGTYVSRTVVKTMLAALLSMRAAEGLSIYQTTSARARLPHNNLPSARIRALASAPTLRAKLPHSASHEGSIDAPILEQLHHC